MRAADKHVKEIRTEFKIRLNPFHKQLSDIVYATPGVAACTCLPPGAHSPPFPAEIFLGSVGFFIFLKPPGTLLFLFTS